ncbi:hypothetical protein [Vulcanisaeta distributa]|uniref:hypothetical protein n=1 Tax=Vulcanisaeta distributa TaxID=164451 RepID=UPI000A729FBF|nr:hypothetical protein [Vulcanisaeta distributa]
MVNYPIIDLHEDIAYYLMNSGRLEEELQDFDVDAPGRQSDIPKLIRGGTLRWSSAPCSQYMIRITQ